MADIEPTVHTVTSPAGGRIGYRKLGEGPAIVIIHGSLDEGSQWLPVAELLASDFTLYLVDSRGRGLSDDFPDDYGPGTIVDDHRAVLAAAGDGAVLFGHSYGATAVLLTAAAGAPELAGVIAYEPPLPLDGPVAGDELRIYEETLRSGDPDGALARGFLTLVGGSPDDLAMLRETPVWAEMVAIAPTWIPELRLIDGLPESTEPFTAIRVPLLALRGGRSGERLRANTARIAEAVPLGELIEIPHIEHSGHLTDPADIAEAVRSWYARTIRPQAGGS